MVSDWALPKEMTRVMGSILAGMYKMKAAITSAQVRAMLLGLRACSAAPQRGQAITPSSGDGAALQRRWQLWQLTSEAFKAVSEDLFMNVFLFYSKQCADPALLTMPPERK